MLLLLVLALAGCVVGQSVNVNINVTGNATGAGSSSGGSTSSSTVHTYPPSTTRQPTAAPTGGDAATNNTNITDTNNATNATTTATADGNNATTAPSSGSNVTSNATSASNNATNVTCADQTSQQRCTAFGRGAGGESTDYRACIWCGVSATDGLCREPVWSGNYSCPLETGSFFNYGCLPGDSIAACGSHCINSCETVCRDFRAPVYTITMFTDSSCTQVLTGRRNLTRACLPLANGGSIGVIAFANNTYSELNYMCANCRPCEPTCTDNHNYCECTKVAGLSNLHMMIAPQGTNCSLNGTQSAGGANGTNSTSGSGTTTAANTTSTVTNTTATASPNATNTTGSGNSSLAGTTSNAASSSAGDTPAPSQRAAAGVLTASAAAIVAVLLLVVSTV